MIAFSKNHPRGFYCEALCYQINDLTSEMEGTSPSATESPSQLLWSKEKRREGKVKRMRNEAIQNGILYSYHCGPVARHLQKKQNPLTFLGYVCGSASGQHVNDCQPKLLSVANVDDSEVSRKTCR